MPTASNSPVLDNRKTRTFIASNTSNISNANISKTPPMKLLKSEILEDQNNEQNTSLLIWKMFNNKNNLLPNNKRILNLSWRLNSINSVKKRKLSDDVASSSNNSISNNANGHNTNNNISLLRKHDTDSLIKNDHENNTEFDYIEHIRRISKEEYGINPDLPLNDSSLFKEFDLNGSDSNNNQNNFSVDIPSPGTSHSLSSNSNSIFSYHQPAINGNLSKLKSFKSLTNHNPNDEFNIDNFLKFDDNLNDLMDFTHFNESSMIAASNHAIINGSNNAHNNTNGHSNSNSHLNNNSNNNINNNTNNNNVNNSSNPANKLDYSLSNYINTLEVSLDDHNKKQTPQNHIQQNQSTYPSPITVSTSPTISQTPKFNSSSASTAHKSTPMSSSNSSLSQTKISNKFSHQPVCENCFTSTTPLWRKTSDNRLLCNACGLFFKLHGVIRPPSNSSNSHNTNINNNNTGNINNTSNNSNINNNMNNSISFNIDGNLSNNGRQKSKDFISSSVPHSAKKRPYNKMLNDDNVVEIGNNFPADQTQMGETLGNDWDWLNFDL